MTYVVQVTMTEEEEAQSKTKGKGQVRIDGKYEYKNLEVARAALKSPARRQPS